ncbi:hypothetical protein [Aliivibrio logei]|uniref:Uncharacterized protein n=1 Tax=Aliivibrio logei TaxID=688 RepID=A0A1B9P0I6_ALILO|nr:hypothetical protein [Aliivibrio logei]OCH21862.1 hypothetical protein A6E04_08355 [Aliivibrio logei]
MKIECPHCQTDNKIEFAENIVCKECEKSFKGFKFSKRKLISSGAVLAVGLIGGYKVNTALDEVRYPLETEYAIVDSCINGSKNMVSTSWYESKRELCLCTLGKTTEDISYSTYQSDQNAFVSAFKQNTKGCS